VEKLVSNRGKLNDEAVEKLDDVIQQAVLERLYAMAQQSGGPA
jgi:hypothetical protein